MAGIVVIRIKEEKGNVADLPLATVSAMWVPHWLRVQVDCCFVLGWARIQRGRGECLHASIMAILGIYDSHEDFVMCEGKCGVRSTILCRSV